MPNSINWLRVHRTLADVCDPQLETSMPNTGDQQRYIAIKQNDQRIPSHKVIELYCSISGD
jgi:hypothetical protein